MMRGLLLTSVLLLTFACDPVAVDDHGDTPGDTRVLAPAQEVVFDGALALAFTGVPEDSRCPVDATCVWEGNARVLFRARLDEATRTFALNTSPGPATGPATASVDGYRITLVEVLPAPRTDASIPGDAYRVVVQVTRD